jgi:hypothetical protein
MKAPSGFVLVACTAIVAAGGSGFITAAESAALVQELRNVKASDQVISALWQRQPESCTLRIVITRSAAPALVNVEEALKPLVPSQPSRMQPQHIPNWRPNWQQEAAAENAERSSRFIADTIARLRAMDPVFSGAGTLPSEGKERRVEVWLLRADGSLIEPATYVREAGARVSVSYGYSIADSMQAVAAAIRIDDAYYIDKLLPLDASPASQ